MRPVRVTEGTELLPTFECEQGSGREETGRLEVERRQAVADVLGVARCPRCRAELVARMGRTAPYFQCRCPRRGQ